MFNKALNSMRNKQPKQQTRYNRERDLKKYF